MRGVHGENDMNTTVSLKLFATLGKYAPPNAGAYPVVPGTSVRAVLEDLGVPTDLAKLIFVDSVRRHLDTVLKGGERVGIFPPVGGG
jgi:molybdopterin synthase sulfur carrier subunit